MVDLDDIAAELYVLPPAQFTAARNARAAEDPGVKSLRKPTVAAWAVNLLAADGQLAEAVELAAALREAQDDLDASELARLGKQRRALVAALATRAATLAADAGTTLSASVRDDVEKTINAAVLDAGAAAAALTGRLVTALEPGEVDPEAVGGSIPGVATDPAPRDDLAERRARKAAEKAAREAERAASEAERERARLDARRAKAQERVDHLHERIAETRKDLERLEGEAAAAAETLAEREAEATSAAERARTAAKAAARARAGAE